MAASIKIPTIFTAVDKFSDVVKGMTNTNDKMAASLSRLRGKMDSASRNMATGGIAIAGGMGIALNSATKFEDKMADVAKTTGLEGKELDSLGGSILDMSKKTRSSIEVLMTPNWNFSEELIVDDVMYIHGIGSKAHIRARKNFMSTVQGHHHVDCYVQWFVGKKEKFFAMQTGVGVDDSSYAMAYGKWFPKSAIGCGVVIGGHTAFNVLMDL